MAVEMNPEVETPVSTGAVKFDGGPYTVEQTADNTTSTGAVEMPGPVTVTHPGFPVQAKVVTAPEKAEPKKTVARTKAVKAK